MKGQQESPQTDALVETGLLLILCQELLGLTQGGIVARPARLRAEQNWRWQGHLSSGNECTVFVSLFELLLAILPHCHFVAMINVISESDQNGSVTLQTDLLPTYSCSFMEP